MFFSRKTRAQRVAGKEFRTFEALWLIGYAVGAETMIEQGATKDVAYFRTRATLARAAFEAIERATEDKFSGAVMVSDNAAALEVNGLPAAEGAISSKYYLSPKGFMYAEHVTEEDGEPDYPREITVFNLADKVGASALVLALNGVHARQPQQPAVAQAF